MSIFERTMDKKTSRGSPFAKMQTPQEAFAEAEYKTQLYGLEGLLQAVCQILYYHPHVEELSDLERMEVAAYTRPVFDEIEEYERYKKQCEKMGLPIDEPHRTAQDQ